MISGRDIAELKKVAKATADYDYFIEPIMVIFGIQPLKSISADGVTRVQYWKSV